MSLNKQVKPVLLVMYSLQNSSFDLQIKKFIDFVGMRIYSIQAWEFPNKLSLETVYNSGLREETFSLKIPNLKPIYDIKGQYTHFTVDHFNKG